MKRIVASNILTQSYIELDMFDAEADRAGYNVRFIGTDIRKVKIILIARKKNLPDIDVQLIENEPDALDFNFKVNFPDISSDELEFTDSAEFIISDTWSDVAKLLTWMMKTRIDI